MYSWRRLAANTRDHHTKRYFEYVRTKISSFKIVTSETIMPSCFRPACRSRGHRKEIVWSKQLAIPDRSTEAWHTRERLKPNAVSYGLSEVTRSTIILFDCRHAVSVRYTVHVYLVGPLAMISQSRAAKKLASDRYYAAKRVVGLDTPAVRWRWSTVRRRRATERPDVPSLSAAPRASLVRPSSARRRWSGRSTAAPVASITAAWRARHAAAFGRPLQWPRVRRRVQMKATCDAHGHILVLGERRDLWSFSEPALLTPVMENLPVSSALVRCGTIFGRPFTLQGTRSP